MPELFPRIDTTTPVTIDEQIEEARRELAQRHRLYPRWAANGRGLDQATAARRLRVMDEIIRTLVTVKAQQERPE